jgi:hypothetical protein
MLLLVILCPDSLCPLVIAGEAKEVLLHGRPGLFGRPST